MEIMDNEHGITSFKKVNCNLIQPMNGIEVLLGYNFMKEHLVLKELIKQRANVNRGKGADVDVKDSEGTTALHLATSEEHKAVVQLPGEKGPGNIYVYKPSRMTLLWSQLRNGWDKCLERFCQKQIPKHFTQFRWTCVSCSVNVRTR
jgi:ankyrin repeat protein